MARTQPLKLDLLPPSKDGTSDVDVGDEATRSDQQAQSCLVRLVKGFPADLWPQASSLHQQLSHWHTRRPLDTTTLSPPRSGPCQTSCPCSLPTSAREPASRVAVRDRPLCVRARWPYSVRMRPGKFVTTARIDQYRDSVCQQVTSKSPAPLQITPPHVEGRTKPAGVLRHEGCSLQSPRCGDSTLCRR